MPDAKLTEAFAGAEAEQKKVHSKKVLGNVADLLERNGIGIEDIGTVQRVSIHQGFYKDDEGEAHVVDMTGVTLSPKWAEGPEWPVVQQAKPTIIRPTKVVKTKPDSPYKVAVILPDPQIGFWRDIDTMELDPFHDEAAIDVALQVTADIQPDRIVDLGDTLDFAEFSRFPKEMSFALTTQAGVDYGHEYLARQRAIVGPDVPIDLIEGNHDCLAMSARCVTRSGYKFIDDLTIGDEVLSLSDDGTTTWEPIQGIHTYKDVHSLVRLENSRIRINMTSNHRVVGLTSGSNWSEKPADRFLTGATSEVFCSGNNQNKDLASYTDQDVRLLAWCMTDSWLVNESSWNFTQRESNAHKILDLLDEVGISYTTSVRNREILEIDGKHLLGHEPEVVIRTGVDNFDRFPIKDKVDLPDWVFNLSQRQVNVLLDEWVETDGTRVSERASVIYCSRQSVREDLQRLAITNGVQATCIEYRPGHWRINLCTPSIKGTTRLDTRLGGATTVDNPDGRVWCITVPSGRFFVESEGTVHLTGNSRITKLIQANAAAAMGLRQASIPDAWPVMSVPHLLRLDELGVTYHSGYPASRVWLNDRLFCIHGHRVKSGGSTAALVVEDEKNSVIFGHVHRRERQDRTVHTRNGPRTRTSITPGCLCKTDGTVPSTKGGYDILGRPVSNFENWQQGFAVVTYAEGDGEFDIEMVGIHSGVAIYRGKRYEAAAGLLHTSRSQT